MKEEYMITQKSDKPFEVLWEELMGWFLIPKEGNRISWAIYDFPERKRSETYEMRCKGKAEIHGLEGVTVEAIESYGKKQIKRHFIAQLTDTHCRYLAERHEEDGVMKYYTFLDGDAFLNNWGFGPDNIGNETHLSRRLLSEITHATSGRVERMGSLDYEVAILIKTYEILTLNEIRLNACIIVLIRSICGILRHQTVSDRIHQQRSSIGIYYPSLLHLVNLC